MKNENIFFDGDRNIVIRDISGSTLTVNYLNVNGIKQLIDEHTNISEEIILTLKKIYSGSLLPQEINIIPKINEHENKLILRKPLIDEMHNFFIQGHYKKLLLTGISGTGKTFLAKHYIHYYKNSFDHLLWLNCSNGILNAFVQEKGIEVIDSLRLTNEYNSFIEGKLKINDFFHIITNRLRRIEGNNLLILDNINEDVYNFEDEINLNSNWKILSTSKEELDGFKNYLIPLFSETDAQNFFYKYYDREKDNDNLDRLLHSIEYHTLTIELFSKTAQQRQLTILQVVNRLIENGINVVEKANIVTGHSKERKVSIINIEKYLNIIFDTSQLDEFEEKILINLAILQGYSIDYKLFIEVFLPIDNTKRELDLLLGSINLLISKGWVYKENDTVRLHNLTKNIILKKNSTERSRYSHVINYLTERISPKMGENYIDRLKYIPPCENLLKNINDKPLLLSLVEGLSNFYGYLGLYQKSLDLFLEYSSLKDDEEYQNLFRYQSLAVKLHQLSRYDEAFQYNNLIFNYFKNSEDPFINIDALCANFLHYCKNYFSYHEFSKNDHLYTWATYLIRNIVLFSHASNDMGLIFKHKGLIDKSIETLQNTLLYRTVLVDGLKNYFDKQEQYKDFSRRIYHDCLYYYSVTCNNLGLSFQLNSEFNKARVCFEECLEIREKILEKSNPNLSTIYHNIANLLIEDGKIQEAQVYLIKDIVICEDLPINHPFRKQALENYERYYKIGYLTGDAEIEKHISTLQNLVTTLIRTHFDELNKGNQNYTNLADYFHIIGHFHHVFEFEEIALIYYKKELRVKEYSRETSDFEIGVSNFNIAACLLKLGGFNEGLSHINLAIELYKISLKDNDRHVIDAQNLKKDLINLANSHGDKEIIMHEIENRLLPIIPVPDNITEIFSNVSANIENIVIGLFSEIAAEVDLKSMLTEFNASRKLEDAILDYKRGCISTLFIDEDNEWINEETIKHLPLNADLKPAFELLKKYFEVILKTYAEFNIWQKAILFSLKKIKVQQKFIAEEHPFLIAISFFNLACYYFNDKKYDLADRYNKETISIYGHYAEMDDESLNIPLIKEYLKDALDNQKIIDMELNNYKTRK